jgi:hypothetical protein
VAIDANILQLTRDLNTLPHIVRVMSDFYVKSPDALNQFLARLKDLGHTVEKYKDVQSKHPTWLVQKNDCEFFVYEAWHH